MDTGCSLSLGAEACQLLKSMKKFLILTVAAFSVLVGCGEKSANDDPRASIAGTNQMRHTIPGGGETTPSNASPPAPAPQTTG